MHPGTSFHCFRKQGAGKRGQSGWIDDVREQVVEDLFYF